MLNRSATGSPIRVAVVQHGDYLQARRRLAAGGSETYGSQRYSIEAQERVIAHVSHVVFSLDTHEAKVETDGRGEYVSVPASRIRWLPVRIDSHWRAHKIIRRLEQYSPTHLILRSNDIIGCQILAWANARRILTFALLATRFDISHPPSRRFCRLANESNVLFVGNHSRIATQSLVECGLRPDKAVAWDFPPRINPESFSAKEPQLTQPLSILFAGMLIESKGVNDVVDAVEIARQSGIDIRLIAYGDGPLKVVLASHPGIRDGWLSLPGVVAIEQLTEAMLKSWLVVVPTRKEFPEAVNLVLMDALATRTPVAISDHPTFRAAFDDKIALPFFQAGNPRALADLVIELAKSPKLYKGYSEETKLAWQSLQIEGKFHELLDRFAEESGISCISSEDRQ